MTIFTFICGKTTKVKKHASSDKQCVLVLSAADLLEVQQLF